MVIFAILLVISRDYYYVYVISPATEPSNKPSQFLILQRKDLSFQQFM